MREGERGKALHYDTDHCLCKECGYKGTLAITIESKIHGLESDSLSFVLGSLLVVKYDCCHTPGNHTVYRNTDKGWMKPITISVAL
jgi:hypothetical protein